VLATAGRKRDPAAVAQLAAADDEERVLLELQAGGPPGLARAALPARTGLGAAALERALTRLLREQRVVLLGREPGHLIARSELERSEKTILDRLAALHDKTLPGVAREALRTSAPGLSRLDARLFGVLLDRLATAGRLEIAAELVRRAGYSQPAMLAPSDLESRVAAALITAGLAPPSPQELATALRVPPARTSAALDVLRKRGEAVRIGGSLFFARRTIDELRERLRAFLVAHGSIDTQQMKALVGGSRKFVIPLAEHFDAENLTLRVGDVRRLRARP
jgi:selenocysteine-specific elongation factor